MEPLGTSGFGTTIEEELSSLHCDLRQVSASIQDAKNLVIQLDTQLDELGEKVGRGAIAAGRVAHNLGKGVGGSLAIGAGVALVGFAAASVMRKWNDYQSKHRIVEVTATAREIASDSVDEEADPDEFGAHPRPPRMRQEDHDGPGPGPHLGMQVRCPTLPAAASF